jgi:hypothetical protein
MPGVGNSLLKLLPKIAEAAQLLSALPNKPLMKIDGD